MLRALALVVVVTYPLSALAQCRADNDCKGDRICVAGECKDPSPAAGGALEPLPPPPPPPPSSEAVPPPPPSSEAVPPPPPKGPIDTDADGAPSAVRELPGWALGGSILGFISAGVVMGFATGSAVTNGNQVVSTSLGATATLIFAITVPIVNAASASARTGARVPGLLGLRIPGWIFYGVGLATALVAVILGVADLTVPTATIYALGIVGAVTEVLFAVDALVARSQAAAVVERNLKEDAAGTFRIAPIVAVAPERSRTGAFALVGVGGVF